MLWGPGCCGWPVKTHHLKGFLLDLLFYSVFLWLFSRVTLTGFPSAQQVSSKLAGLCQPGPRDAAASSSMVCLLPGAVTFSCVRSMSCLLSSHHSECAPSSSIIIIRIRMQTSHLNLNLRHCPNLRLHLYGVCEAWRGVLPSPAPAAHRRQVRRGGLLGPAAHTRSHRSVAHQGCWALHEVCAFTAQMF